VKVLEYSDNFFVPINDTDTFMNGTIKFLRQINAPWRAEFQFQKYIRGEWILELKKTYDDACIEIHNKVGFTYFFMKNIPSCPIAPGVS
jgi:hypothetical protein